MKKLINDVRAIVPDMLAGLVAITPGLAMLEGETVVLRADSPLIAEVALISGGGAGHEPAHAGYVGPGMLAAAVSGDVFTSPSTDAVLAAIRAVAGPPGVLLIVKNYTGDRLNFGLAAELARADGIAVDMVIVEDDVALADDASHAGRRGLAGTVLIHKIAGAAAAAGMSLAAVKQEAEAAKHGLGTMGVALSSCTVPAAGKPGFTLGEDEIELGLGIHGEPGISRAPIENAEALTASMLDRILGDRHIDRGARVALLVNGLGATPPMELAIITGNAIRHLETRGIVVERAWTGSFLTALDMAGCSLSLLPLDDLRLSRLDAETKAPAWPARTGGPAAAERPRIAATSQGGAPTATGDTSGPIARALRAVFDALRAEEARLTELDAAVGDGDLGASLARGVDAAEASLASYDLADAAATLRGLAATLRRAIGGSSGPLYAAGLLRAASVLATATPTLGDWARALRAGAHGISEIGGARRGDRTMLDALLPAADALQEAAGLSPRDALERAVVAGREGAARAADMVPRKGRSSYLGARAIGHKEPGAEAVVVWLEALRDVAAARPS